MIISAAKQLHAAKMAVFDERSGNLFVTELGRVASHFYIRCVFWGFNYATSGVVVEGEALLQKRDLFAVQPSFHQEGWLGSWSIFRSPNEPLAEAAWRVYCYCWLYEPVLRGPFLAVKPLIEQTRRILLVL
jgi:hypothetical protein